MPGAPTCCACGASSADAQVSTSRQANLPLMRRLEWVRRLQTITQAGLTYTRDPYDRQRYEQLQELAAEIAETFAPATSIASPLSATGDSGSLLGATVESNSLLSATVESNSLLSATRDSRPQLGATHESWLELIRAEKGYATPKVDVRGVVERDGKLLFMREAHDGLWSLPGGWADIGESPSQIAEREVLEETGFVVKASKLLAVYDKARHAHPPEFWYCYKMFVRCELRGGAPARSIETLDTHFFGVDELPPLSTPRVTEAQVRRMFEHLAHPELPTDFD
jgi:ADP-ribose pyrophosphatase YjhB (NUDIX family)